MKQFPYGTRQHDNGPDLLEHHPMKFPVSCPIPTIPFDYLQTMKLLIDVEFALAGNESFAAVAIKQAIRDKKPATVILTTLKDMATDNFDAVADMLGNSLTRKVLQC